MESQDKAKKAAGRKAVEFVKDGMLIGLGTGSTSVKFIQSLGEKCREGLKIEAIATSHSSEILALALNIPIIAPGTVSFLDMCFDGADEINKKKQMIKGGGGALLREKIIASMSGEMVVLIDEHKIVNELGNFPLPVEIIPFGYKSTISKMEEGGFHGTIRLNKAGENFITDNGNYIYDIRLTPGKEKPEAIEQFLISIPGIVETGFFLGLAGRVIVGKNNGEVTVID